MKARMILGAILVAASVAGCSAMNPIDPPLNKPGFSTKLCPDIAN